MLLVITLLFLVSGITFFITNYLYGVKIIEVKKSVERIKQLLEMLRLESNDSENRIDKKIEDFTLFINKKRNLFDYALLEEKLLNRIEFLCKQKQSKKGE